MKINLYGTSFIHNIVDGKISSTANKKPNFIEFVTNDTGEINLFVDLGILDVNSVDSNKKNFAWILESKCIHPELINIFKENQNFKNNFEQIFTHNQELIDLDSKFKFLHPTGFWVNENLKIKKTKLISMIASSKKKTKGQKKRNKIANKFSNKIDLFGEGRKYIKNKEEGLTDYCFSIVVENDFTNDYFSEKILDCFATKTIPIYLGSNNITNYFDETGIIFYKDFNFKKTSFDLYSKMIEGVNNNYEIVKKYKCPEDTMYEDYLRFLTN